MRTKEELASKEFDDNVKPLINLLTRKRIAFSCTVHTAAKPDMLDWLGYYPTGKWHIKIGDVSVIKGMCSFGMYEAYGGKFDEPTRFKTAKELIKNL